jgi:hypothetical protein
MSNKTHRSALGRPVDMASLRAKNEKVRAIGNMLVNARGDTIDSNDNVINDANRRVNEHYMRSAVNRGIVPKATRNHVDTVQPPVSENEQIKRVVPDSDPVSSEEALSAEEMAFESEDEVVAKEIVKEEPKQAKAKK